MNAIMETVQSAQSRTILQIANLIVMVVSIWFFTKIAPITQQVALIEQRVTKLEATTDSGTTIANTVRISNLEQQYSRLENKIDLLIQQSR